MSDHYHYEYAEAGHEHRGEYASDDHDHHYDYAEKRHRHYDDESTAQGLREDLNRAEERVRELEDGLRDALNRIHVLEDQTPEARQAEYEADVAMADSEPWRDTLADYHVASGGAEYADDSDCGCGLGAARCRELEDGGAS